MRDERVWKVCTNSENGFLPHAHARVCNPSSYSKRALRPGGGRRQRRQSYKGVRGMCGGSLLPLNTSSSLMRKDRGRERCSGVSRVKDKGRLMGSVSQLQSLQWAAHTPIMGNQRANGMTFLHEWAPIFHRPKCGLESFLRAHSEPQVGWECEADWLGAGRDTYWLGGMGLAWPRGKGGAGLTLRSEIRMRPGSVGWNRTCR